MNNKLNCIMLVDDNEDDNFFHEREIKKTDVAAVVVTKDSAIKALEYLKAKKEPHTDLIFLDINMPGMNGWEFLKEYNQLDKALQGRAIIIMLTTSDNPDDVAKANTNSFVSDYITKPLTKEIMEGITKKYFKEQYSKKLIALYNVVQCFLFFLYFGFPGNGRLTCISSSFVLL